MIYIIIAYFLVIILIIIDLVKQKKSINRFKSKVKFSRKTYDNLVEIYNHIILTPNEGKNKNNENNESNESINNRSDKF